MRDADFIRRIFIAVGIAALVAAAWLLRDAFILAFGAVIVAVVLQLGA